MAMGRRRKGSGVTDFLSNIVDDIKDFVDDEIIDRGRDTERDVRRTAGDLTDERNGSRLDEIGELRDAIRSLAGKIEAVAANKNAEAEAAAAQRAAAERVAAEKAAAEKAAAEKAAAEKAAAEKAAADKAAADRAAAVKASKGAAASNGAGPAKAAPVKQAAAKQPWPRYDEQTVVEIREVLATADAATVGAVRAYESRNKKRQGVLKAASAS
jgi:hypothetical protein